jgi:hypothetical protein
VTIILAHGNWRKSENKEKCDRLSLELVVACKSRCCVVVSPGFNAKFVVERHSQTLPAANITFGGLHRDLSEKKLNLLEFASGIMAEPRRTSGDHVARDVECSCWLLSS